MAEMLTAIYGYSGETPLAYNFEQVLTSSQVGAVEYFNSNGINSSVLHRHQQNGKTDHRSVLSLQRHYEITNAQVDSTSTWSLSWTGNKRHIDDITIAQYVSDIHQLVSLFYEQDTLVGLPSTTQITRFIKGGTLAFGG